MIFSLQQFCKKEKILRKGYILPLTMLLTTLIMLVSFGITSIIVRQARFSRIVKDSFIAYNAADMAVNCTAFIDNSYQNSFTSNGIFPTDPSLYIIASSTDEINDTIIKINQDKDTRGMAGSHVTLSSLQCGGVHIFTPAETDITYSAYTYVRSNGTTELGKKSVFTLKIPLSNGDSRCAKVIFNKSPSYNQIIASGYSTCDTSSKNRLERVIVSSTESS